MMISRYVWCYETSRPVEVVPLAELAVLRDAAQAVVDASVPDAEADLAPYWRRLVDVLATTREGEG